MERLAYHQQDAGQLPFPAEQLSAIQHLDSPPALQTPLRRLPAYEPQPRASPPEDDSNRIEEQPTFAGLSRATAFQTTLDLQWAREHRLVHPDGHVEPADANLTRNILAATVEVLDGHRPAMQIHHYVTPRVFAAIQTRARDFSRTAQGLRLRSVHLCQPVRDVIEACGIIQRGKRFQALVARLESKDEGWLCTLLRLV